MAKAYRREFPGVLVDAVTLSPFITAHNQSWVARVFCCNINFYFTHYPKPPQKHPYASISQRIVRRGCWRRRCLPIPHGTLCNGFYIQAAVLQYSYNPPFAQVVDAVVPAFVCTGFYKSIIPFQLRFFKRFNIHLLRVCCRGWVAKAAQ